MELFVHAGKDAPLKRVEVDDATSVADFVREHGSAEGALWIEDGKKPVDEGVTVGEAGVTDGARVYAGRCKRVEATIDYADEDPKTDEVPPASTIKALL